MSSHAVYNTIWMAYLEQNWCPVKITIFRLTGKLSKPSITERLDAAYQDFKDWLKRFSAHYHLKTDLDVISCDEEDYESYADMYREVLRNSSGSPQAIDITPGRKFAAAIGLKMGIEENVDSIFYLHLLDDSYANLPYPQIPRTLVKLVDFKKGVSL